MTKSTHPRLHRLLAQAIAGQETDLSAFEPDELLETTEREGVAPLLYDQVRAGRVSGLDSAAVERLQALSRTEAAKDLWQSEATRATLALLADAGIDALLLKGTPLAHRYYPASHLRPRCDVDLFIDSAQVQPAAERLGREGYEISGLDRRKNASRQFVAALPSWSGAYIQFDLHWQLSNRVLFRSALEFAECREQAGPVPALGPQAMAPCAEHLLLHACIHRIAHGRGTERDRLIWLYDIHLLCRAMDAAQWAAFTTGALEKRLGALCADALRAAQALFAGDPEREKGRIAALEQNAQTEPSARLIHASRVRWALSDLAEIPGLRAKLGLAREFLLH